MSSMVRALEEGAERKRERQEQAEKNRQIPRHKPLEEWSPADHVAFRESEKRPENPEWTAARAKTLTDAGLEPDDEQPKPLEEMTPADHAKRRENQ